MRVFVTGATGFVGSAVVDELVRAGHQVVGLARSDDGAKKLQAAGASVLRGELGDFDILKQGAAAADGVAHLGFQHDFANMQAAAELDRKAILALGEALKGTDKPLLVTSGLAMLTSGRAALETDVPPPPSVTGWPRISEPTTVELVQAGVRAMILRLSPTTHGRGDHGFVPMLIGMAREKGVAAYVGDGTNRWPAVHRLDAAVLYRLALESELPAGTVLHAAAEEGVPFRAIEETIGEGLGLPVQSKTGEDAAAYFTWMLHFAGMDMHASSQWTRDTLQWRPVQPGLLADMRDGGYFDPPSK